MLASITARCAPSLASIPGSFANKPTMPHIQPPSIRQSHGIVTGRRSLSMLALPDGLAAAARPQHTAENTIIRGGDPWTCASRQKKSRSARRSADFIRDNLPEDIRKRLRLGYPPRKQDTVTWQRILNKRGWAATRWPKEWGGTGLDADPAHDLPGRESAGAGAGAEFVQHHHARAGADPVRHRRAEAALSAARREPR